jgi:hypothetical protein
MRLILGPRAIAAMPVRNLDQAERDVQRDELSSSRSRR